jgi:hypothetical protein
MPPPERTRSGRGPRENRSASLSGWLNRRARRCSTLGRSDRHRALSSPPSPAPSPRPRRRRWGRCRCASHLGAPPRPFAVLTSPRDCWLSFLVFIHRQEEAGVGRGPLWNFYNRDSTVLMCLGPRFGQRLYIPFRVYGYYYLFYSPLSLCGTWESGAIGGQGQAPWALWLLATSRPCKVR